MPIFSQDSGVTPTPFHAWPVVLEWLETDNQDGLVCGSRRRAVIAISGSFRRGVVEVAEVAAGCQKQTGRGAICVEEKKEEKKKTGFGPVIGLPLKKKILGLNSTLVKL